MADLPDWGRSSDLCPQYRIDGAVRDGLRSEVYSASTSWSEL